MLFLSSFFSSYYSLNKVLLNFLFFFFWQIPIILSENQWCPTFSVARETALPFPAWQLIRVWKTCSWKHVPVKLWPLVCSFLPAWSKASLSTTHRSPTRAVMSAQEFWRKQMSDHMTTTWQWDQVRSFNLHVMILPSIIFFFEKKVRRRELITILISFQFLSLPLQLCCRLPKEWFWSAMKACTSPATPPTSMAILSWSGSHRLARWDPSAIYLVCVAMLVGLLKWKMLQNLN